jgi:hypothetical protein
MLTQLASARRQVGRSLLAAPLLLALTLGASCSQKAWQPVPSASSQALTMSNAVVYIDGQRQDSTALQRLNPADIASLNVVKGAEARAFEPNFVGPGIVFVTTRQNQYRPDVVAFNARQQLGGAARANDLAMKVAQLPANAAYFLNGRASTREVIAGLDSTAITRTDVLQGAKAAALAHDDKVTLAIAVLAN